MNVAVRDRFSDAMDLGAFLAAAGSLTAEQRILIARQALILIEQNYAHLPLKRAMHSVDPVQRLKLLVQSLEQAGAKALPPEVEFHREMTDIFTSVRDLHTNYLLPAPFSGMTAFLPFMVEDYWDAGQRRYIVSHVVEGFEHEGFVPGVEILYWNGMPIDRAVRNNAQRYAGSNLDARHARGVQTLTTRVLTIAFAPDEEWVVIHYRTLGGKTEELRVDWVTVPPLPADDAGEAEFHANAASAMGIDLEQHLVQRVRESLFAPNVVRAGKEAVQKARTRTLTGLESAIPSVLQARAIDTATGTFGYLRIRSFSAEPSVFIPEVMRLLSALPQRGLIIDVRGNGGGIIHSGELMLQLLTPRRIEPEPAQFINTALNLQICRRNGAASQWTDLSPWAESMQLALQTGATFSAGFPITDPDACNAIGQRYFGPVVLITDARCYSTTDIFAAGFQDHEIGPILGTDGNTGAGGANVWEHRHLAQYVLPGKDSLYKTLPNGAGMRVSMRRTLRVGRRAGTPVEDLGVIPERRHFMTRNDLLNDNADLLTAAGTMLASMPVRRLQVVARRSDGGDLQLIADVEGINRLDVYVDDRPIGSINASESRVTTSIPTGQTAASAVEVRGYDDGQLVARYRAPVTELMASGDAGPVTAAARTPSAVAGAEVLPTWRAGRSLIVLRHQVNAAAPARSTTFDGLIGDDAHAKNGNKSDHNPWVKDGDVGIVTACDITHDPTHGCDANEIAEAIRASRDVRVKYVIWNGRISNSSAIGNAEAWAWRPYTGPNPHDHHVHISVKPEKALYDSAAAWAL
jgi:hypothetical protein